MTLSDDKKAKRVENFLLEFTINESSDDQIVLPTPTISLPKFDISNIEIEEDTIEDEPKKQLTAKISRTTFTGLVIVKFNTNLKPLLVDDINESHIDLKILINDGRNYENDDEPFDYS